MSTSNNNNLSTYGDSFQIRLLACIIGNRTNETEKNREAHFGVQLVAPQGSQGSPLKMHHFSLQRASIVLMYIIDYFKKFQRIPFYDELRVFITTSCGADDKKREIHHTFVNEIETCSKESWDRELIRSSAINYIINQSLMAAGANLIEMGKNNQVESAKKLLGEISTIVSTGQAKYRVVNVSDNPTIDIPRRNYFKSGLGDDFDECFGGGWGKKDFIMICAGSGVGKSTLSTVLSRNYFKQGLKVLQVYFEDNENLVASRTFSSIVRKRFDNSTRNDDMLKREYQKFINEAKKRGGVWNQLKLIQAESTTEDLEQYLKESELMGIKYDVVLCDYLDCFKPKSKTIYKNVYDGEIEITIDLENMADKYNFLGINFTQGNRGIDNVEWGTIQDIGGSIAKVKKAHVFMFLTRTRQMVEENRANLEITIKNRLGRFARFPSIEFNNALVQCDVRNKEIENAVGK